MIGRQLAASAFNEALEPALALAVAVVTWDFKKTSSNETAINGFFQAAGVKDGGADVTFLRPEAAWRPTLLNPQLTEVFFELAGQLRSKPRFAHKARQTLLSLSNLEGEEFFETREERFAYYSHVLARGFQWLVAGQIGQGAKSHPDDLSRGQELADGCKIITNLLQNMAKYKGEIGSAWGAEELSGVMTQYGQILSMVFAPLEADTAIDAIETWLQDCVLSTLQGWCCLIPWRSDSDSGPAEGHTVETVLQEFTPTVFETYLSWRLTRASLEAVDASDGADAGDTARQVKKHDEDDEESEVHLASTLARFRGAHSLPLFTRLLSENSPGLSTGGHATDGAIAGLLESVKFVVADNAHGELPTVPARIHAASAAAAAAGAGCPVVAVLMQLQEVASIVMQNLAGGVVSMRTAEELLDTFSRAAPTYLSVDRNVREYKHLGGISPPLQAAFSVADGGAGNAVVEFYVNFAVSILMGCPSLPHGAPSLARGSVQLLLAVAKIKTLRPTTMGLESWHRLMAEHASDGSAVVAAVGNGRTMRLLGEALCCNGLVNDVSAAAEHFAAVKGPIASRLQAIVGLPNFAAVRSDDKMQLQIHQQLAALRGIARASEQTHMFAVYSGITDLFPTLVLLVDCCVWSAPIVSSVFKLAAAICDGFAIFLSPEQCTEIYTTIGQSIHTYAGHYDEVSALGGAEGSEIKYKHASSILLMLTTLTSKAMFADGEDLDALITLILDGIRISLLIVDSDLLQYPKIRGRFFEVITFMVDTQPAKMMELPTGLFQALMQSLEHGLETAGGTYTQALSCLEAIKSMAVYAFGHGGAGAGTQYSQALMHFLQVLLNKLLFKDIAVELIDASADATLVLILCNEEMFGAMVASIVSKRPEEQRERLQLEFQNLVIRNELGKTLDRENRGKFRKNMLSFLSSVRSFIH